MTIVDPSITPGLAGNFSETDNCPPTLVGSSTSGGPSCTISVMFTPVEAGYSTATLEAGTGSDGPAFATLTGTGIAHGGAAGKSARKKCANRKHRAAKASRKCRKHKRRG